MNHQPIRECCSALNSFNLIKRQQQKYAKVCRKGAFVVISVRIKKEMQKEKQITPLSC